MAQNLSKKNLSWTESHEAFCHQHHITPATKILWQWLARLGEGIELEPHLTKEFNAWITKIRGKGFSAKWLKHIFNTLVECRVIRVIKKFNWDEFRLVLRPIAWLNPPKKKSEEKSEKRASTSTLDPSNDSPPIQGDMQQQHSRISENLDTLAENNIHYNADEKEVLARPKNEIKLALILFSLRGGFEKATNAEGWIRDCLRYRYWEEPRNYNYLLQMFGNSTEWDELFPSG